MHQLIAIRSIHSMDDVIQVRRCVNLYISVLYCVQFRLHNRRVRRNLPDSNHRFLFVLFMSILNCTQSLFHQLNTSEHTQQITQAYSAFHLHLIVNNSKMMSLFSPHIPTHSLNLPIKIGFELNFYHYQFSVFKYDLNINHKYYKNRMD